MAGRLHLIGEFPCWDMGRVFSSVKEAFGHQIRFVPADALQNIGDRMDDVLAHCHEHFVSLKRDRCIAADAKLQINLPFGNEPIVVLAPFLSSIPAHDLAVQVIYPLWRHRSENNQASSDSAAGAMLAELVEALPAQCGVVVHFCCQDGASYKLSPADLEAMVTISNAMVARLERGADVLHFPVPLRHEDDEYFRGLAKLDERALRALSLGLIHLSDGAEGALSRIRLAQSYANTFMLAARCGFSKRTDAEIAPFLALHSEVLKAVDGEHGKDNL